MTLTTGHDTKSYSRFFIGKRGEKYMSTETYLSTTMMLTAVIALVGMVIAMRLRPLESPIVLVVVCSLSVAGVVLFSTVGFGTAIPFLAPLAIYFVAYGIYRLYEYWEL